MSKLKVFALATLGFVAGSIIDIVILIIFRGNMGNTADWFSGIGSFCAVLTIVFDYFDRKKQKEKEFKKTLPVFNINSLTPGPIKEFKNNQQKFKGKYKINVAISAPPLFPLENLHVELGIKRKLDSENDEPLEDKVMCNPGHIFPSKEMDIESDNVYYLDDNFYIDSVEITCLTIQETSIKYVYNNKTQRGHFFSVDGQSWVKYHK